MNCRGAKCKIGRSRWPNQFELGIAGVVIGWAPLFEISRDDKFWSGTIETVELDFGDTEFFWLVMKVNSIP
jgi:hypothetical protein